MTRKAARSRPTEAAARTGIRDRRHHHRGGGQGPRTPPLCARVGQLTIVKRILTTGLEVTELTLIVYASSTSGLCRGAPQCSVPRGRRGTYVQVRISLVREAQDYCLISDFSKKGRPVNPKRVMWAVAAVITLISTIFVGTQAANAQDSLTIGGRAPLVDRGVWLNIALTYSCTFAGPETTSFAGTVTQVTKGAVPVIIRGGIDGAPATCDGVTRTSAVLVFAGQGQYPWEVGTAQATIRIVAGDPMGFPTTLVSAAGQIKVMRK